jgi:hypothetical protein
MQEMKCEPVLEQTTVHGKTIYLALRVDGPTPPRLRAHFQHRGAVVPREVDVLRSSRDGNQLLVVVDGPGHLGFSSGDEKEIIFDVDFTEADLALVRDTSLPSATGAPSSGDPDPAASHRHSDIHRIVTLQRTAADNVISQELWKTIRKSSKALSFKKFSKFAELAFSSDPAKLQALTAANGSGTAKVVTDELTKQLDRPLIFRVDSYDRLKVIAEVFVAVYSGVRQEFDAGTASISGGLERYLGDDDTLPYLQVIYDRLGVKAPKLTDDVNFLGKVEKASELIERKAQLPCLIELIWSYWHEEGMLAQTMAAIAQRFQNRRALGDRDPLAQFEVDPLRPLNHLLWRHVQTEGDRLSVLHRAHEYQAEYGFPLHGKAVAALRTSDRCSKFLEAFHNLLYRCVQFYRVDDDTTHVADGFPVLNALKETHYVLSQGASNQFGDLPATARQEMLIEQWMLARPEMRDFLGGRQMVAYPEPWMDRVDVVKGLMRWSDVSSVHFHDLAVFGERLLLSIRWDHWSAQNEPDFGKQWAREWRPEVQGYIHAIRAVLGVDLAADVTNSQDAADRYLPPSVHLRRRLEAQMVAR